MRKKYWLLGVGALLVPTAARCQRPPAVRSMLDGAEPDGAIRYVGGAVAQRAGAGQDIGAQINAAYASLPAHGGTIIVLADPAGRCYDFITPIVAAMPGKYLLLESGALPSQVAHAPSIACLNYLPTNSTSAITLDHTSPADNAGLQIHGIHHLTLTNNRCEMIGGCGNDSVGVSVLAANGASFDGLRVVGFGTGVSIASSSSGSLSVSNCIFSENGVGLSHGHPEGPYVSIDGCQFQGNGTGISSSASLRVSDSSIVSSTVVGITCSSPAACDLSNDHFENAEADTTHFLVGNGVFSVLGGDMRDDHTTGTTDWWMNFAGATFFVLGTSLTSAGRPASAVILNEAAGWVKVQNNSPEELRKVSSRPTTAIAAQETGHFPVKDVMAVPERHGAKIQAVLPASVSNAPSLSLPTSEQRGDIASAEAADYVSAESSRIGRKRHNVDGVVSASDFAGVDAEAKIAAAIAAIGNTGTVVVPFTGAQKWGRPLRIPSAVNILFSNCATYDATSLTSASFLTTLPGGGSWKFIGAGSGVGGSSGNGCTVFQVANTAGANISIVDQMNIELGNFTIVKSAGVGGRVLDAAYLQYSRIYSVFAFPIVNGAKWENGWTLSGDAHGSTIYNIVESVGVLPYSWSVGAVTKSCLRMTGGVGGKVVNQNNFNQIICSLHGPDVSGLLVDGGTLEVNENRILGDFSGNQTCWRIEPDSARDLDLSGSTCEDSAGLAYTIGAGNTHWRCLDCQVALNARNGTDDSIDSFWQGNVANGTIQTYSVNPLGNVKLSGVACGDTHISSATGGFNCSPGWALQVAGSTIGIMTGDGLAVWQNKALIWNEGTPNGAGNRQDSIWGDATSHRLMMNNNNSGPDFIGDTLVYNSAGTAQLRPHIVVDTVTLTGASTTVLLTNAAVFSNATAFSCLTSSQPNTVVYNSGNSITFSGSAGDTIRYICVGN